MKRLVLDTSGKYVYTAILDDDKLLDEIKTNSNQRHASIVVKTIEDLLKKNNLKIDDIDELIGGIGPGTYTGLRVCVTVLKTISYSKNIKLKTISSLYLMSSNYEGYKLVYNYASKKQTFTCLLFNDEYIYDEEVRDLEEFKKSLTYNYKIYSDDDFKINPKKVIKNSKYVDDVFKLVPNYLRG